MDAAPSDGAEREAASLAKDWATEIEQMVMSDPEGVQVEPQPQDQGKNTVADEPNEEAKAVQDGEASTSGESDDESRQAGEVGKESDEAADADEDEAKQVDPQVDAISELRAEIAALRKQLETPKTSEVDVFAQLPPVAPQDLVATSEETAKQISNLRSIVDLASSNPEGVELTAADGQKRFYTPEELQRIRANAQTQLAELAARAEVERALAAANYRAAEAQHSAQAMARFAWMRDSSRPETQMALGIVRQLPEIRRFPNWREAVGYIVEGLSAAQRSPTADNSHATVSHTAASSRAAAPAKGLGAAGPVSRSAGSPPAAAALPSKGGAAAPATVTTNKSRVAPVAPRVGTGVASGPVRRATSAKEEKSRALGLAIEAINRGDESAELDALISLID